MVVEDVISDLWTKATEADGKLMIYRRAENLYRDGIRNADKLSNITPNAFSIGARGNPQSR
jgi:hypothetical protein